MSLPKSEDKYTYDDYLKWPDNERWELIHGSPYDMSPAPSRRHQQVSMEIASQIHHYIKGTSCHVYAAPFDVRFPNNEGIIDTVVQPDISVICDENKLDDNGCIGPPDLILEILSPSTAAKDLREKFSLYELSGVKEYWVVDLYEKIVFLFSLDKNNQYSKPQVFSPPDKIESDVIKGMIIDLDAVFA